MVLEMTEQEEIQAFKIALRLGDKLSFIALKPRGGFDVAKWCGVEDLRRTHVCTRHKGHSGPHATIFEYRGLDGEPWFK